MSQFFLDKEFVARWGRKTPQFGFNGLGEVTYQRTYARPLPSGGSEQWFQTIERVVNAIYNIQKKWIEDHRLGYWKPGKAQRSAQDMYARAFDMKFLPPGRGLWAAGSPLTNERQLFASLNNCAFVSTEDIGKEGEDPTKPFTFLMDASMLGVGVGFDTKGAGSLIIQNPHDEEGQPIQYWHVQDSREGWVEALGALLERYFVPRTTPLPKLDFDYSLVRPKGAPIKGFGGTASGPGPLKKLFGDIRSALDPCVGLKITGRSIVDICNLIGCCVVAGNVRRTAEIAFGEAGDEEFIGLKDYAVNPERAAFGWASNNSVFAQIGMDYGPIAERIRINGEPGIAWLENMRAYSRMADPPNHKDHRAQGANVSRQSCRASLFG